MPKASRELPNMRILPLYFSFPQQFPAGEVGLVYILGVVNDAHGAPGVGGWVLVVFRS